MRLPRLVVCALAVPPLLLAGCSADSADSGGNTAAGTSTGSAGTGPSTAAPSSGDASAGETSGSGGGGSSGCPMSGHGVPAGTNSHPTIDVDGDGRPDTEWIAQQPGANGGVPFGLTTASGATFTATIRSASPVARSVLVADVSHGQLIALASDGRQVLLYAISACSIVPVQNAQGQQYAFDLGFTGYGTGVGCTDVNSDGTRDLVGLQANSDNTGYSATVVTLNGPTATNSDITSGVADAGPAAIELAHSVTCGSQTMAANGSARSPESRTRWRNVVPYR